MTNSKNYPNRVKNNKMIKNPLNNYKIPFKERYTHEIRILTKSIIKMIKM